MDVDTVADELYGLRPEEFTETRNERARQARSRGQRELARDVGKLRKPTAGAWVVNLLVREAGDEVDGLLQLGEQLRAAQAELQGEQLRALSQQRSDIVSALAGQGRRLARESGHAVSESVGREVERTLEAALADPEAAERVRSGRLTAALSYSGLGPLGDAGGSRGRPAAARARLSPGGEASRESAGPAATQEGRRTDERSSAGAEERRAAREAAERSLAAAMEAARYREDERNEAQRREDDLRSRKEAAAERVSELEGELERARDAAANVGAELEDAARRREEAARVLAEAQQRVDEARRHRERLSGT